MQLIGEMPLSALSGLLAYARERETEEAIRPLWMAHYTIAKLSGGEAMPYDELLRAVMPEGEEDTRTKPTADEIESRFKNVVEADRRRNKG